MNSLLIFNAFLPPALLQKKARRESKRASLFIQSALLDENLAPTQAGKEYGPPATQRSQSESGESAANHECQQAAGFLKTLHEKSAPVKTARERTQATNTVQVNATQEGS
ncbi:hypothetical protein [uncultured Ottowia sp.]|uniref:hypothetical protein n=1 Tax=uncultured Ottowia sp. TaxID=543067 RepID=UPI0025985126|nr:hypothetical protein [uncultured Ottowia sp.]